MAVAVRCETSWQGLVSREEEFRGFKTKQTHALFQVRHLKKCSTHHCFGEGWQKIADRSHFVWIYTTVTLEPN